MSVSEISDSEYEQNVFINCPYDSKYEPLFIALVFAVHDLGFKPRCALETENSGEDRLKTITDIIAQCKYSIHDLSRIELDADTELPRFNMAFELGLDLGCSRYGDPRQKKKVSLVMDAKEFRYRSSISDIAGNNIHAHESDEEKAVRIVRKWLSTNQPAIIPKSAEIFERYKKFLVTLPVIRKLYDFETEMHFKALSYAVAEFLNSLPPKSAAPKT